MFNGSVGVVGVKFTAEIAVPISPAASPMLFFGLTMSPIPRAPEPLLLWEFDPQHLTEPEEIRTQLKRAPAVRTSIVSPANKPTSTKAEADAIVLVEVPISVVLPIPS